MTRGEPILLLDVMSTLVRDPFFDVVPAFFGLSLDELLRAKHPRAWIDFEHGRIDEETFLARFFADGRAYDRDGFVGAVERAYAWLPDVPELLTELRDAGAIMHALSNYPRWYLRIERRLGLSRLVPWTFVSCETGLRKPDPAAYLGAAAALGVPPASCLFIDDREDNCAAARAVGMDTIRFRSAGALREALAARGVLPQRSGG